MVKKRADEEIISNDDDFENEDSINLEKNSNFEDEANEEEKDVKPFTSTELTDWEDRRASNSQDTKTPKDESELSSDTVRMYLKEIGRVNLLSAAKSGKTSQGKPKAIKTANKKQQTGEKTAKAKKNKLDYNAVSETKLKTTPNKVTKSKKLPKKRISKLVFWSWMLMMRSLDRKSVV